MDLIKILKEKREKLSASSLKTYDSILRNLYHKVFPGDKEMEIAKFNETEKFMDLLKDVSINKRKSYLTALVVLTGNETYQKQMMVDGTEFNESKQLNKKSKKEQANWISQDELKTILNTSKQQANMLYKLKALNSKQIQQIQNYVILSLMSGKYIPIRRLLDWSEMQYKKPESDTGNYLNVKPWTFVFNVYKTSKFLGKQEVIIPPKLKAILKKWIVLVSAYYPKSTHLLTDSFGNKLSSTKLNQRLNKILGKNISINSIRHSYISEKYKDIPQLKEIVDDAHGMSHSLTEHLSYIKR
jgi:ribosomal silencing factor RsfS